MKNYFALLLFALPMLGYSIGAELRVPTTADLDEVEPVSNFTDANGLKQGFWVIYGKDMPEKGYPADGKIEEGEYKDSRKTGNWIMYHADGVTPKLIGNFVDHKPNGPYIKYSLAGAPIEKGGYHNGKQKGEFITYHENGAIKQQKTFNADGQEDGPSYVYYDDGTLQMEVTKVNGVKTGESKTYWPDGSVKNIVVYGADGEVVSTTTVNAEPPVAVAVEVGAGGPSGAGFKVKDGKYNPDGFNKLYNKADELEMSGTFKGGKLWEGELYKYDSDGILLKIEIWKNGKYHSDGQL